jgi:hypothetical protein
VIKKSFLLLDIAVLNLAATLLVTVTVTLLPPTVGDRVLLTLGNELIITLAYATPAMVIKFGVTLDIDCPPTINVVAANVSGLPIVVVNAAYDDCVIRKSVLLTDNAC